MNIANDDKKIIIENITEGTLEDVKYFLISQLDEMVLPYIYQKRLPLVDVENPIYQEYANINADINGMMNIFRAQLSEEEKKQKINDLVKNLYQRTKRLIINVSLEKKNNKDVVSKKNIESIYSSNEYQDNNINKMIK